MAMRILLTLKVLSFATLIIFSSHRNVGGALAAEAIMEQDDIKQPLSNSVLHYSKLLRREQRTPQIPSVGSLNVQGKPRPDDVPIVDVKAHHHPRDEDHAEGDEKTSKNQNKENAKASDFSASFLGGRHGTSIYDMASRHGDDIGHGAQTIGQGRRPALHPEDSSCVDETKRANEFDDYTEEQLAAKFAEELEFAEVRRQQDEIDDPLVCCCTIRWRKAFGSNLNECVLERESACGTKMSGCMQRKTISYTHFKIISQTPSETHPFSAPWNRTASKAGELKRHAHDESFPHHWVLCRECGSNAHAHSMFEMDRGVMKPAVIGLGLSKNTKANPLDFPIIAVSMTQAHVRKEVTDI